MRRTSCFLAAALAAAVLLAACGGRASPQAAPAGGAGAVGFSGIQPGVAFAGAVAAQLTLATTAILSARDNTVLWNGQPVPTSDDTGFLVGAIPAADLATPGVAQVSIQLSNNTVTNALPFYILPAAQANAGVVQLISINLQGQPTDGPSSDSVAISAKGRYVAFQSAGDDLTAGPRSGHGDIYERDTCIGAPAGCVPSTIRISVSTSGALANGNSYDTSISADGRYVAFDSAATNLAPGSPPPGSISAVFLRDTCIGAPSGCAPSTVLLSVDASGAGAAGAEPAVAQGARYIAWQSAAAVFGGAGMPQIADRDTCIGAPAGCVPQNVLASASDSGAEASRGGNYDAISPDGRFVAFQSWSHDLVAGVEDAFAHVYLRYTCLGAPSGCIPGTTIMDATPGGTPANYGSSDLDPPAVSAGGRYVAFDTDGRTTNLSPNPNQISDLYIRDTCNGAPPGCAPALTVVTVPWSGAQANGGSDSASITPDGRYIAFASLADNLVLDDPGPPANNKDIFVRDTCAGAPAPCTPLTLWASVAQIPTDPYVPSFSACARPALSADGHYVAFISNSQDLLDPFHLGNDGQVQVFLAKTGF